MKFHSCKTNNHKANNILMVISRFHLLVTDHKNCLLKGGLCAKDNKICVHDKKKKNGYLKVYNVTRHN